MKRAKRRLKSGRCCWVCGRPGGEGFTSALRQIGYEVPMNIVAHAHPRCMQQAARKALR